MALGKPLFLLRIYEFILFKRFYDMDHFESLIELVTILFLFYVLIFFFLATRHLGSLFPDQGLNLHPLHWKAEP